MSDMFTEDGKYIVGKFATQCPFCGFKDGYKSKSIVTESNISYPYIQAQPCTPCSRVKLSGEFWWKKFCKIPTFHMHCWCPNCHLRFIVHHPAPPKVEDLNEEIIKHYNEIIDQRLLMP